MMTLRKRDVTNGSTIRKEVSEAEFIPYQCHWDKETIFLKDEGLLKIIKVEGFAFETADDEDLDIKKLVRNTLLKSIASGHFALWFHVVRRKQSAFPAGTMEPGSFAEYVNDAWHRKHGAEESFINDLYISILYKADKAGLAKIEHLFRTLYQSAGKNTKEQALIEAARSLNEVAYRMVATLKDYRPHVLTTLETDAGTFSEPLEFLGRLVNGGMTQPMQIPLGSIDHYLPTHRLYFGNGTMEIRGPTKTRYGALIAIREYAPASSAGIFDGFLQLPFEFILTQSFTFVNRQTNIESMQVQQRRMIQSGDVAISQTAEISDALDMAMSGHAAFGEHHFSILCLEDSPERLETSTSMAVAELTNVGISAIREKYIMEATYWAQLPGNYGMVARKAKIHTLNLAGMASLHNYPVGRIRGNHWGDAVTVFDTASGTPYFFNFHLRDVGHTMIVGPTGAGKTVLLNFLCAQAQKFNCRLFFFDKDRGAEIFIRALGGEYRMLEPSNRCGFNPLMLPDTGENRTFLGDWMRAMATSGEERFSAEDMDRVMEAVAGNYKLEKKDRLLHNVSAFLGLEEPGSLAHRLRMWHSEGQYAGLFDNPEDILDFSNNRVFGFEMGRLLDDRTSLGPTLLYLFHRISLSLDGTPTIIVLDEAWALIDNPIFAARIKDWLKTLRKLNALVVFATQSVEDASKSAISDTLVQQTATQIFLPNPKATDVYRQVFMISDREFNLLKTTDPGSRFFLLKHGKDVVIARINLQGMEDVIHVLSGRAETVRILDEVRAEHGDNPADWLPAFQERLSRVLEE